MNTDIQINMFTKHNAVKMPDFRQTACTMPPSKMMIGKDLGK